MFQIVYVSSASHKMNETELLQLLQHDQARNQENNITGMMLYDDGNIFQVLEGEQQDVEAIYESIESDQQSLGHIVLLREEISTRTFNQWQMAFKGFKGFKEKEPQQMHGFSEFLEEESTFSPSLPLHSNTRSKEIFSLLKQFKKIVSVH